MTSRPVVLFALTLSACTFAAPTVPAAIAGRGYELVFEENFDGPAGAPADPKKWRDWTPGARKDGWNVPECARLDGKGHLAIVARRGEGGRVETGGVWTRDKAVFTHGYFECRCLQHTQPGFWSAFWITSDSIGKPLGKPDEAGVEIDVMEYLPTTHPDTVLHTLHWDGYAKGIHRVAAKKKQVPGLGQGWHTYAVKWDDSGYTFYTDGKETGRIAGPVSNRHEYLLLTCEVGTWAGDIANAKLPDTFLVDSVRVWQTPAQRKRDAERTAGAVLSLF